MTEHGMPDGRHHGPRNRNSSAKPVPHPAFHGPRNRSATHPMALPPDLQVLGQAAEQPEYWHLPRAEWEPIHSRVTGKGIVVANLDTGYNPKHKYMPQPIAERSFVRGERDAVDHHGHGTHTIVTTCGRDPSVAVAPEATLIVGKVLGRDGGGSSEGIAAGVRWAIEEGANVISMSLGGNQPFGPTLDAIDAAQEAGIVVVAAAGNSGYKGRNTIGWPAKHPGAVCIGAYKEDGGIANFSSGGREIDIACPGQNIVSAGHQGRNAMVRMSGTSMATPYAAGLFALVLELVLREGAVWPRGVQWWRGFLAANVEDRGAPGDDDRFGAGVPRYTDIVTGLNNENLAWV